MTGRIYSNFREVTVEKQILGKDQIMYEFTEDCMIHIPQIDDEHKHLFALINEAVGMMQETTDVEPVAGNLLRQLKEYANTHFAHEEAYMESIRDPELEIQRKEHNGFRKKVNEFVLDTSSEEKVRESFSQLMEYLVRWLYHHILSSDMMIGKIKAADGEEDVFAFTDKYKTGIELVDDEHRRLFEIIKETNDLINTVYVHDKYDEIMQLLAQLRQYTEIHFSDEEAFMEKIGYPELPSQKQAHAAFVEKLVDIDLNELDEIDDNQQEYLAKLVDFLLGWLSNHILVADKKIGEYYKKQLQE